MDLEIEALTRKETHGGEEAMAVALGETEEATIGEGDMVIEMVTETEADTEVRGVVTETEGVDMVAIGAVTETEGVDMVVIGVDTETEGVDTEETVVETEGVMTGEAHHLETGR